MADMDLSTYDGLKSAVADYLNRGDLTEQIPGFIALAESRIKRKLRRTAKRATIPLGSGAVVLPADVAELRSIHITGAGRRGGELDETTPAGISGIRAARAGTSGRPTHFTVVGNELLLAPEPDAVYDADISYFEALTPLSADNTSNSVLAEAPGVYLYGALAEAMPFIEEDQRSALWATEFNNAIRELNIVREREEFSAQKRTVRLARVFG